MTETTGKAKRGLFSLWSTREIMITAMLGLAFGAVWIPLTYAYVGINVFGPIASWAMVGVWLVPAFFAAYVIRRPGAALLITVIAALVLVPTTPYGMIMILSGSVYAISAEVGIAIGTRYKNWSLVSLLIAAVITGAIGVAVGGLAYGSLRFELAVNIAIAVACVGSVVLAAIVAKFLADAVARTGLLSGVALGEGREEV